MAKRWRAIPWRGGDVDESTRRAASSFWSSSPSSSPCSRVNSSCTPPATSIRRAGSDTISILAATAVRDIGFALLAWVLLVRHEAFDWRLPRTGGEWGKELGWGIILFFVGNRIGWLIGTACRRR